MSDERGTDPSSSVKFDYKDVRTISAMEARTVAKWEKDGWELVSSDPGPRLRKELRFRRPRPNTLGARLSGAVTDRVAAFRALPPARQVLVGGVAGGALVLVLAGVIVAASLAGGDDTDPVPSARTSTAPSQSPATESDPTEDASAEPAPDQTASPEAEGVLTVKNNADLDKLLTSDEDYDLTAAFVSKYAGRTIRFNGSVDAVGPGDGGEVDLFNVLVSPGAYSETEVSGPPLQFLDVSDSDVGFAEETDAVRVEATVVEFDEDRGVLVLSPVLVTLR